MLLKQKASLSFIRETASKKISLGENVINALSTNIATFPNPPVAVATLVTSNNDLLVAERAAHSGDHYAVATLQNMEKTWDNNFRLTANYVSIVADGNEATIRLAAFVPTKAETTPVQLPAIPSQLTVLLSGMKGGFNAVANNVSGAKAYVFAAYPEGMEITYNGDVMQIAVGTAVAYLYVGTNRKAQFANIPSGTSLYVSAFAVNSAGCGPAANGQNVIPQ